MKKITANAQDGYANGLLRMGCNAGTLSEIHNKMTNIAELKDFIYNME